MAKANDIFKYKTFCLITGASKGYGQSIAINFAPKFAKGSFMLLLARSKDGLKKTKNIIANQTPDLKVAIHAIDLGSQDDLAFQSLLVEITQENSVSLKDFENACIIHNAGSLGDVSKNLVDQNDMDMLKRYWDLNLTSVIILNSVFLKLCKDAGIPQLITTNITSICALQPFKSWSLYCAGKAARDMLFRTMAEENPDIKVLNYAPGPIDTDMQYEARTITGDKELKDMFADMKSQGKLLCCDQSVEKLVKLLQENTFDSGAHIDYYDL